MSTIIRATDHLANTQTVAFNFDDMAVRANQYLAKVRIEAQAIIAKAQQEAELLRKRAETEGRQAGMKAVDEIIAKQLSTVMPALKKAVQGILDARYDCLTQWGSGAVHLAAAMAKRLVRRELKQQPEINLTLVREALQLAAGSPEIRILLNPRDLESLGNQVRLLVEELSPLIKAEIIAQDDITAGGCRVETMFGVIDQQFESQIQRIEEELKQ